MLSGSGTSGAELNDPDEAGQVRNSEDQREAACNHLQRATGRPEQREPDHNQRKREEDQGEDEVRKPLDQCLIANHTSQNAASASEIQESRRSSDMAVTSVVRSVARLRCTPPEAKGSTLSDRCCHRAHAGQPEACHHGAGGRTHSTPCRCDRAQDRRAVRMVGARGLEPLGVTSSARDSRSGQRTSAT